MAAAVARSMLSRRLSSTFTRRPLSPGAAVWSRITPTRWVNGYGDSGSKSCEGAPFELERMIGGCDYEHWLVLMDKPGGQGATKQQMTDCYIQTLAKVVGSEQEAKRKIYSVLCERCFGFRCQIDEETSKKLEGLPGVVHVLPEYGGKDKGICAKDEPNSEELEKYAEQFDLVLKTIEPIAVDRNIEPVCIALRGMVSRLQQMQKDDSEISNQTKCLTDKVSRIMVKLSNLIVKEAGDS